MLLNTRVNQLKTIHDDAWATIRATEDWADTFKQTPMQWRELMRSENRMMRDLKVYFRLLAAERVLRYVNWNLYNAKTVKAAEIDDNLNSLDAAKKFGADNGIISSKPAHQEAIEAAMNSGNLAEVERIIREMPDADPYKQSMISLFRDQIPGLADVNKPPDMTGLVIGIDSEQAQAEEQLLLSVMLTEIQTGMLQGALGAQETYTVWLGQSEINTLVQEQSATYSAELVKGITQTTLDAVQASITKSIRLREDIHAATARLQEIISDPARAELIARTESVRAFNAGILKYGRQTGALQKSWEALPGADEGGGVQPCVDDSDQGPIAIDDLFSSGDDFPPAHPRCRCSVSLIYDTGDNSEVIDDNYA